MGWRDRDWAKFDEAERQRFFAPRPAPARRSRVATLGGGATAGGVLLAAVATGIAIFATSHQHALHVRVAASRPSPDAVAIRFSRADLAPATLPGRICVSDPHRGRFCASYLRGESPATELTKTIQRAGLAVTVVSRATN